MQSNLHSRVPRGKFSSEKSAPLLSSSKLKPLKKANTVRNAPNVIELVVVANLILQLNNRE